MNIDWSKAPEGATHYTKAKNAGSPWLKVGGEIVEYWVNNYWTAYSLGAASLHLEKSEVRPCSAIEAWDGKGLPPAGTVCEVKGCMSHYLKWNKVTVFAVRGKTVLFDMQDGRWGQTDSHEFRAIRTPEQIAQEERDTAIYAMCIETGADRNCAIGKAMEILHDAGYRK